MLLLSMLSACKVVDAPENLEALMVFGFVNFDQEDDEYLQETAESLLPLIKTNFDDLTDDGYRVNTLTKQDLDAVGIENPTADGIVGAMGLVDYTNKVDPVIDAVSRPDKDVMFPDSFIEYDVLEQSDRDCFLDRGCDRLEQEVHEIAKVALLGEAERTYQSQYRRIETESKGEVVFVRQLSPDEVQFSSNIANVFQQYSFVMVYMEGGTARRIEAFWVDAEIIGLDVPDSYAVDQAVKQMSEQAARIDAFIDLNE
jgi:hypothetical protein